MTVPYTYLLHHIPTNTFYYGVRWKKNCHPDEFWKKYFTSSKKKIPELRLKYGDNSFEFEIRKTFNCAEKAIIWENKVLRRMKVLSKPQIWLNRTNNKAILNEISPTLGRKVPEEQKRKQSEKMKGNFPTNAFTKGHIPWSKGKPATEEQKRKQSEKMKGKIPWNKGLTIDDPRVKSYADSRRGKKYNMRKGEM